MHAAFGHETSPRCRRGLLEGEQPIITWRAYHLTGKTPSQSQIGRTARQDVPPGSQTCRLFHRSPEAEHRRGVDGWIDEDQTQHAVVLGRHMKRVVRAGADAEEDYATVCRVGHHVDGVRDVPANDFRQCGHTGGSGTVTDAGQVEPQHAMSVRGQFSGDLDPDPARSDAVEDSGVQQNHGRSRLRALRRLADDPKEIVISPEDEGALGHRTHSTILLNRSAGTAPAPKSPSSIQHGWAATCVTTISFTRRSCGGVGGTATECTT
jgi:hypothetical protein